MYQEETTYLKGAIVLHMLRHIVGDADFFRGISLYLKRHAFGAVESVDLEAALREASGRNLRPFFEDWIRGGGGHPSFVVGYQYVPSRQQVDLSIRQVHADLPFENEFRLPVQVEVVTAAGARVHDVTIDGWSTQVSLPADGRPSYVVFDKGGWLVSETRQERPARGSSAPARGRGPGREAAGSPRDLRAIRAAPRSRFRAGRDPRRSPRALGASPGGRRRPRPDGRRGGSGGAGRRLDGHGPAHAPRGGSRSRHGGGRRRGRRAAADGRDRRRAGRGGGGRGRSREAARERAPGRSSSASSRASRPGGTRSSSARSRAWPNLKDPGLGPVFERYLDPRYSRHLRQAALDGWINVRAGRSPASRAAPRAGPGPQPRHPRRGPGRARTAAPRRGRGVPPRVRRGGGGREPGRRRPRGRGVHRGLYRSRRSRDVRDLRRQDHRPHRGLLRHRARPRPGPGAAAPAAGPGRAGHGEPGRRGRGVPGAGCGSDRRPHRRVRSLGGGVPHRDRGLVLRRRRRPRQQRRGVDDGALRRGHRPLHLRVPDARQLPGLRVPDAPRAARS